MKKFFLLLCPAFIVCAGCKLMDKSKQVFIDKTGMNLTVKPGDDFYEYSNGIWFKRTRIPADQSGWGSFYKLYDDNLKKLKDLLTDLAAASNTKGSLEQKSGDFYASGMDTDAIEKKGYEPLKPWLQKIDAVRDYKELMNLLAAGFATGNGDLLGFSVSPDEKNSVKNIAIFSQTGLTLPERDYYFKTDSLTLSQKNKMVRFAAKLLVLTGTDSATALKKANDILKLETEIAASHRTPVELRDAQANYNKKSLAELEKLSPSISWHDIFMIMGIHADSVNIQQPKYYESLSQLLVSEPIEVWKSKIAFDYISLKANRLSKAFRDASFEFDSIFSGQSAETERWKTIVSVADRSLRDVLGQLFVQKYFQPEAKQRMDDLVNNLQKAFAARIARLDWMSDSTKQKAQQKLSAFLKKIGYPSKWKNFDDVDIDRNDYFANRDRLLMHYYKEDIGKIGKPVDRTEWGMTPPTVNAYYNPTYNEIVFPAGILQPPFFDFEADDAVNYGGIGMVIGHEMTHGFDDQGRQYDAEGNLKDWWTKNDADKFKAKADIIVRQYDQFTILDTLHINGQLTLGENLADIGGISIAYDAFKLTEEGKGSETIDGFTPDQRFFLGFAQAWRLKVRPQTMRTYIATDEHSPEHFRVDGPLYNFDPFYKAFDISDKDKMYRKPEDRTLIW
ncbi:MAG TPA: M13 family metallopeptidase [Puia sp.]|nr:M13 family metallopeptidase [Puia sp.]